MFCAFSSIRINIIPYKAIFIPYLLLVIDLLLVTSAGSDIFVPMSYIVNRFVLLFSFIIIINYVYVITKDKGNLKKVENLIIKTGVFFSIIALILFVSHVFNLGDLPRTRVSTSGELITSTIFTFESGVQAWRAMGTFREPSILAMALILPALVSLQRKKYISLGFIIVPIYLTYSLGALIAIIISFVFGMLLISKNIKTLFKYLITVLILIALIGLLTYIFGESHYLSRLDQAFSHNLEESSRGYVYGTIEELTRKNLLFGGGIGSGAYRMGEILGLEGPVSLLSLYISTLSTAGVLGLIILIYWLSVPIVRCYIMRNKVQNSDFFFLMLALLCFYVLYGITFEELHVWHAVALGLLLRSLNQSAIGNDNNKPVMI